MALVKCPECGQENVSSNASACPNCGFDLRAHFQKIEREQAAEERRQRAEENLRMQQEMEQQEYFRRLDSIPEPPKYGKTSVYVILGVVALLFLISGVYVITVLCLLAVAGYWYTSNQNFKKYIADPEGWRAEELRKQEQAQAQQGGGAPISGNVGVVQPMRSANGRLFCPVCGSEDITQQVFQENSGSRTITQTTSKYKESGHGCLWWLCIGWWWWFVDLCLWIFAFWPRLILRLFASPFKKKKYKGSETSVSTTVNDVTYRTVCTCKNCGHTW